MFVLFQRIWIFLIVDCFLLFLIIRIARQKITENSHKNVQLQKPVKIKQKRGEKLYYYLQDENGQDRDGVIEQYPCELGRGKECDIMIREEAKQGKYYLSRELIQITQLLDGFRVTRCRRENEEQKTLSGIADGVPFENEVSIKFQETLDLTITKQMILHFKKEILRTSAI